ncbi:tryptophan-rich sensory protein [Croceiramulus getboli]|nr:tryptophan-rich sensory protein [Flavobacteriaceae bacterium YJPT1-3]
MKKTYALLNLTSVIGVLLVNGLSQSQRWNNTTIGEMSNRYDNLFTPASYAFSIWGLIFLMLLFYGGYQVYCAYKKPDQSDFILQTGPWLIIANAANMLWVVAFTYDYVAISVVLMLVLLFSLVQIILRTNMERWDAPFPIIAFVWWPICLYSGWIAVATIANVSTLLTKWNWNGASFSEVTWTLILIVIAALLNLVIIQTRNMREFAAVGIWAFVAIYTRHVDQYDSIAWTALSAAIILGLAAAIHGYKNRHTNPFNKLKEEFK